MTDLPQRYARWSKDGIDDKAVERKDGLGILTDPSVDLAKLIIAAGEVRRHYFSDTVTIHILDNLRSGNCNQDCGYCGQSIDSEAEIQAHKRKPNDQIIANAKASKQTGAYRFCMALSGPKLSEADIKDLVEVISSIKSLGLETCLSAGALDEQTATRLKDAGLDRFNHNLNTSQRHYPSICTTHTYADRLETIQTAKSAGLGICSGVIVGMGERYDDLLDVAYQLRELKVESIPVNFLIPIKGNRINTPTCNGQGLTPEIVLRVLCMFRLVNPSAEIRIAAGREIHLGEFQPLALWPANSLFVDGYLLTDGSTAQSTIKMITDSGFTPRIAEGVLPDHGSSSHTPTIGTSGGTSGGAAMAELIEKLTGVPG